MHQKSVRNGWKGDTDAGLKGACSPHAFSELKYKQIISFQTILFTKIYT